MEQFFIYRALHPPKLRMSDHQTATADQGDTRDAQIITDWNHEPTIGPWSPRVRLLAYP